MRNFRKLKIWEQGIIFELIEKEGKMIKWINKYNKE